MFGMDINLIAIFFIAVSGLVIGSFLNVCIYRLPLDKSVVFPASHCPKCGNRLSFFDLIPVLSFIILKGNCRYCGCKVPVKYPLVELLSLSVSVLLFINIGFRPEFFLYLLFSYALIALFFSDLETQIIPDQINIFIMVLGFARQIFLGAGNRSVPENIFYSLAGMAACGGILYLVYLVGGAIYKREALGGGDIKFGIALGAFFGWQLGLLSIFISFLAGSVYSLFLLGAKLKTREQEIPFGPAMVIAAFVVMFFGNNILSWYLGL